MLKTYHTVLADAGIRPSVQRVAVYSYLEESKNHPTVETVFAALSPEYPTLSRTTIYNTLKLFEEKKLVRTIQIEDDKLRYDSDMSEHIHFKCMKCGEVFDVFNGAKILEQNEIVNKLLPLGFSLEKLQTNIWGICSNCNMASLKTH